MKNTIICRGKSKDWSSSVLIHTDGASRGNPGDSSTGLVVHNTNGDFIYEEATLLGRQTNNFAEYSAVLRALKLCNENKVQSLNLKSDSQLLVKQLQGLYKVKSVNIVPIYKECLKLKKNIPSVEFSHVFREQNKRADELANLILDGLSV